MKDKLYVNGQWVNAKFDEKFDVLDRSNRKVFHKVPRGRAGDINSAVRAARDAFDNGPWPRQGGGERAALEHGKRPGRVTVGPYKCPRKGP